MLGIASGVLGILMMIYTIEIKGTNTLLDLRALSIMMISSVGGFVSTVAASFVIIIYRIWRYGITQGSMFALLHVFLYIVSFQIINKCIKDELKNWFIKLMVVTVILVTTFLYLLRNVDNSHAIIFTFALVNIFAGSIEYFLLRYARRLNELYRIYKKDSTKDFLTGLSNKRDFNKLLSISFERAVENKEKLSCLMIDIDYFKNVNDTYGHSAGDIVLMKLAGILKKNCRTFDIIGRVGGEEFCALLLDCPVDRAFEIAASIKNAVKNNEFFIEDSKFINITVSIGVASYPDTVTDLNEIMEQADRALYKAKQTGRDRVCDNVRCVID
jgi:diguanylate cyclase